MRVVSVAELIMNYTTHSPEETKNITKEIANQLHGGDIVLLHGDLGAGKTTFVKGIAEAFGITDDIVSPTFTLMNVYEIRNHKSKIKNLIHVDTYRLENEDDLMEIGIEDYLGKPDTVCFIEWPEKIQSLLNKKNVIQIFFEHATSDHRTINVILPDSPTIFRPSAGGVVLNVKDEVLIVNQGGKSWSLPKGGIEPNENILEAAKREIYEESGIQSLDYKKTLGTYQRYQIALDGSDDTSIFKQITMFLFRTEQTILQPQDPNNPEARWVKKEEVADLLTHRKDKAFFLSILPDLK